jgi:hypothetical protein
MKRLDKELLEIASNLEKFSKVPLPPKDPLELGEGFRLEFKTLRNQLEALSMNCQHVSYESEFIKYRTEMDRRMKLMTQYADSNLAELWWNCMTRRMLLRQRVQSPEV